MPCLFISTPCYSECTLKKKVELKAAQKSKYFQYVIKKFLKLPEQKKFHLCINCDKVMGKNILAKADSLLKGVGQAGRRQTMFVV